MDMMLEINNFSNLLFKKLNVTKCSELDATMKHEKVFTDSLHSMIIQIEI